MARLLVTGGAGLVGSHLCDRLIDDGHEVIAVDDLSTGAWANLAHLKRHPRFLFVEHDVTQGFHAKVDGIFHLALPTSMTASVTGTLHVLEVARRHGIPVVLASSMSGESEAARVAETVALGIRGVDVRPVRSAHAYGPRMGYDDVLVKLLLQALGGVPLDAGCDADTTLELAFAADVAAVLVDALERGPGDALRVAPWVETSVGDLAAMVARVTGAFDGLVPGDDRFGIRAHGEVATELPDGIAATHGWLVDRVRGRRSNDRPSGAYLRGAARRVA